MIENHDIYTPSHLWTRNAATPAAVDLPEGTSVQVIISANDSTQENKNPAHILAQIAALPLEGDRENFSGCDHDRILYSHQK